LGRAGDEAQQVSPNTKRPPVREGVGTSVPASSYFNGEASTPSPVRSGVLISNELELRFFLRRGRGN